MWRLRDLGFLIYTVVYFFTKMFTLGNLKQLLVRYGDISTLVTYV